MKKLLFLFFLLTPAFTMAQDVIVKKDGSTIVSKVLEITSTEVKYKKYNNLSGPTYSLIKTDIQVINYENGTKESFESVTSPTINQPTQSNPSLSGLSQVQANDMDLLRMAGVTNLKAQRLKRNGIIIGTSIMAAGTVISLCSLLPGESYFCFIGGPIIIGAGLATTIGCVVRAHNLKKQSEYAIHSAPIYQHDFAFSNGTALSTGVDMLKDSRMNSQTIGIGLRYNF